MRKRRRGKKRGEKKKLECEQSTTATDIVRCICESDAGTQHLQVVPNAEETGWRWSQGKRKRDEKKEKGEHGELEKGEN